MTTAVRGAAGSDAEGAGPEAVVHALEPTDAELLDWELLGVDPSSVVGEWADQAMSAAFRVANRAAWSLACWISEASHASAGSRTRVSERRRAGKVPAASLGWSEGFGAARIEFARQILHRLPRLGAEMEAGRLEEHKAGIFASTLADLDEDQARGVVDDLVSRAPSWSYRQLRDEVEKAAKAADPGWAEARKAAAIARRRVVFGIEPSGSAALRGLDLPLDPAQDSHDRIVALAAVVSDRLRTQGRDLAKGQVEAEVLLVLTGPAGAGLWDDDVVELVLAQLDRGPDPDDGPNDDGPNDDGPNDGPNDDGPNDDRPNDGGPADGGSDDGACGDGPDGGDGPDDDDASSGHGPGGRGGPGSDGHTLSDGSGREDGSGDAGGDEAPPGSAEAVGERIDVPSRRRAVPFLARAAIRAGLRTVLGLDHRPGLIPGRGSVCSSTARSLAWNRADATWRLILYDAEGRLEYVLTLRPPRAGPPGAGGRRRRHVVELTAYSAEVDDLATILEPDADVPEGVDVIPGDVFDLVRRAADALAAARARPPHEHPAVSTADAHRRMPGTALRLWVLYRDLSCRGMGCAKPATVADVDHTHDHALGGRTVAGNLGPFCKGDHLFKHDGGTGWTVVQSAPGRFDWTAPTGRRHTRIPEPYDPLPDPVPPGDGRRYSVPSEVFLGAPRPRPPFTPRPNRHGYVTAAARDAATHLEHRAVTRSGVPDAPGRKEEQEEEPPF